MVREDGYQQLKSQLPPLSRRGFVLIDPPYELKSDYQAVVKGIQEGHRRFATGTYAVWYPETQISIMLVLVGLGFTLGNYLGGVWANRSVSRTLYGLFALLALTMVLFPLMARDTVTAGIMLVIWGAASFGIVPPLQVKVMQVASEAQALASSVNIGAFNLGNAVGAALGASVLANGGDYAGK